MNNKENNIIKEFVRLVKTEYGDKIKYILLFGSKARGDSNEKSDIDIFILMKEAALEDKKRISDVTFRLLLEYGVYISPIIVSEKHYNNMKRLETAFIINVEKEGIKL